MVTEVRIMATLGGRRVPQGEEAHEAFYSGDNVLYLDLGTQVHIYAQAHQIVYFRIMSVDV